MRRVFWTVIIKGEHGLQEETTFDFKYIPDLQKTTQMEEPEKTGLKQAGVERRNLQALVMGCGFFGITIYVGIKLVGRLTNQIVHFAY